MRHKSLQGDGSLSWLCMSSGFYIRLGITLRATDVCIKIIYYFAVIWQTVQCFNGLVLIPVLFKSS